MAGVYPKILNAVINQPFNYPFPKFGTFFFMQTVSSSFIKSPDATGGKKKYLAVWALFSLF